MRPSAESSAISRIPACFAAAKQDLPLQPNLQIISEKQFQAAQSIREERGKSAAERTMPLSTTSTVALLGGIVYCGHCGAKLSLTTNGKYYPCTADQNRVVIRHRYICYGKTRKQTECDGQTRLYGTYSGWDHHRNHPTDFQPDEGNSSQRSDCLQLPGEDG